MILMVDEVERYIGLEVKDPYGRKVGRIVAVYSEVDGSVTGVELEVNEDTFTTIPVSRIRINDDGELQIIPEWKAEALSLIKQLDKAKRRIKALDDLYSKNEIPRHAYDEFRKKVERNLSMLKIKAKEVKQMLKKRTNQLEDTIIQIEKAITALKMSYLAGELSEKGYKTAIEALRQAKDKAVEEKEDIKKILSRIENLEREPVEIKIPSSRSKPAETKSKVEAPATSETPILVQVLEG